MSAAVPLRLVPPRSKYDFEGELRRRGVDLPPLAIDTLQVNITKLCNQTCRHCHVDASPARREMMSPEGLSKCLEILEVGSSRVDLQACKLEYSIVSPK